MLETFNRLMGHLTSHSLVYFRRELVRSLHPRQNLIRDGFHRRFGFGVEVKTRLAGDGRRV